MTEGNHEIIEYFTSHGDWHSKKIVDWTGLDRRASITMACM